MPVNTDKRIDFLISAQEELRSEVKQRISQRDSFATQFLVGCGTVITLSMLEFPYALFLIWLMPLVTIFYSIQILYSYTIHDNITRFLRKHIEPELARMLEIKQSQRHNFFWETRCSFDRDISKMRFPGIRRGFFEKIIFFVPVIVAAYFVLLGYVRVDSDGNRIYNVAVLWACAAGGLAVFEALAAYIAYKFRKINDLQALGERDYLNIDRRKYSDRAVFLDRDGTIIVDKVQPKDPNQIEFFADTVSALKNLQSKGYLLIIITNQDGIKQGKLTKQDLNSFNKALLKKLDAEGITIDAVYYSPYDKDDNHMSFKPNPGMIYLAAEDFRLDLENSYLIGDQYTDYIAGIRAGVTPLYVKTGIYKEKYEDARQAFFNEYKPKIYKNLTEAVGDIPAAH